MIKVAIAGTNGLAQLIANYLATTTSHAFIVLSRQTNASLTQRGWQVLQVDYSNSRDLQFKLNGVDVVISTVGGNSQLALIDAAAAVGVRRFVPAEFEGSPSLRPANDVLDRGRRNALLRLRQHETSGMKFTVFTCGIFYERFGPGGLATSQVGRRSNNDREGDYIVDFRRARAELPYTSNSGQQSYISMTSMRDVARFVVAALDFLHAWPREYRFRGGRISIANLVAVAEDVRDRDFEQSSHTRQSFHNALTYARAVGDTARENQLHYLAATAEGQFDFDNLNLNQLVSFQPERFQPWLARVWNRS